LHNTIIVGLERHSVCDKELCYSIEITSDRGILYKGMKNGHVLVKKSSIITQDDLDKLLDHIQHIYFFTLDKRYISSGNRSDSEACYTISVTLDEKFKKITFDEGRETPLGLRALQTLVESIAKSTGVILQ
jgi:hypothetical protein